MVTNNYGMVLWIVFGALFVDIVWILRIYYRYSTVLQLRLFTEINGKS